MNSEPVLFHVPTIAEQTCQRIIAYCDKVEDGKRKKILKTINIKKPYL